MNNINCKPIYNQSLQKRNVRKKNIEIKTDTKTASFNLYKEGKIIEQIARERNMSVATIEGHLSYFVGIGELDINAIISAGKQEQVKSAIEKFGHLSHKTLKENLPDNISYGEIRMVMASIKAVI